MCSTDKKASGITPTPVPRPTPTPTPTPKNSGAKQEDFLNYPLQYKRGMRSGIYQTNGIENKPVFYYDDGFSFNPKATATIKDRISWGLWGVASIGAYLNPSLQDAAKAYSRYRTNRGGENKIDYKRAYEEDSVIRNFLDNETSSIKNVAREFYKQGVGDQFEIISAMIGIPNGEEVNWQRTIGAHNVYTYSEAKVSEDKSKLIIQITFVTNDKYNFNPGAADINSGRDDYENGRFSELGWAKDFITVGEFSKIVSVNLD